MSKKNHALILLFFVFSCSPTRTIQSNLHTDEQEVSYSVSSNESVRKAISKLVQTNTIGKITHVSNSNPDQLTLHVGSKLNKKIQIKTKIETFVVDTLSGKKAICFISFKPLITPTLVTQAFVRGTLFSSASEASNSLAVMAPELKPSNKTCLKSYYDKKQRWQTYLSSLYQKNLDFNLARTVCSPAVESNADCSAFNRVSSTAKTVAKCQAYADNMYFCGLASKAKDCMKKGSSFGSVLTPQEYERIHPFCADL